MKLPKRTIEKLKKYKDKPLGILESVSLEKDGSLNLVIKDSVFTQRELNMMFTNIILGSK